MNTFVCIKDKLIWDRQIWRAERLDNDKKLQPADEITMEDEPRDGKGWSLVNLREEALEQRKTPGFKQTSGKPGPQRLMKDQTGSPDFDKMAEEDPRTNSQIRSDIKKDFDNSPSPKMKKSSLLSLEAKLRVLYGKDAAIRTNDEMTLGQAQGLVKGAS